MKKDDHQDYEASMTASSTAMDRREFLKRLGVLGGGIIVYFTLGDSLASARMPRAGFLGERIPVDFNAFLKIGADNRITCYTGKIEMGQGPITSLAQMLAEELDVSYEAVEMMMGDTQLCPWDAGTFGSLSTRYFGVFLREAACEAKAVLKELAADYLMCPVDRLQTKDGVVFDQTQPRNRVTYGRLTRGKVIEKHLKELPPLKPTAEFAIMGKSYLRRDSYEKVTGKAQYAADIRLPGMVYAKILRPPAHGARLKRVDTSAAERIDGVQILRDGDLIAVVHERPDEAEAALAKVKAEFDIPQTSIDERNIFDHLIRMAPKPTIVSEDGDLKAGEGLAAAIFEETYLNSYVSHAPLEPHAALAVVDGNQATLWASTQAPFTVREQVAKALNFPPDHVRVIAPFVGGGFGGKVASDQAVEAARLAKLAGRPVQVAWSRAEEFFYDTFRPAAVVKIRSGINRAGQIVLWDYNVYFAGHGGSEQFYEIPHHRESAFGEWRIEPGVHPFAVGPWRAPAVNTNVYARDLQMNIMASKAGMDPLEFRLNHLKEPRMIAVLRAAAKQFGWKTIQTPSGFGYGISCGIDSGTYVAAMAEVAVDRDSGKIQAKRVVCAQDMGFVVNPEGATIQMEGCITMGLGYALAEEIRFKNGEILDLNFDTYEIPRFSWLPQIETVLVENPNLAPQGGGEPAIVCMGGVLATAVYDACGAKLLQLPMTAARVKEALKKM